MAPHHTGCRARRIQKNTIERPSPPETLGLAAIADHDFRRELQSGEIFGDTPRPHAVRVHRDKLALGKLEQVSGFPARRPPAFRTPIPSPTSHTRPDRRTARFLPPNRAY